MGHRSARQDLDFAGARNDTGVTADVNVINGNAHCVSGDGQPAASEPSAESSAPLVPQPRSMPKSPIARKHVDDAGRFAYQVFAGLARAVSGVARYGARATGRAWRAIDDVPPALRLLLACGLLMLLGIVGSIALTGTLALMCAIVVVPTCSMAVGALGHRRYSTPGDARTDVGGQATEASDLQRSVVYVDKKLTVALNSFGSDRHQQAVIALFQAKTAVELALGSEHDTDDHIDEPVSLDDYGLRPRIQAGSRTAVSEGNSLAAS